MNVEKINQLTETIENKMREAIDNSDLGDFFASQGLVDQTLKLKVMLDLNQIRNADIIEDPELRDSLRKMPGEELMIISCYGCTTGWC